MKLNRMAFHFFTGIMDDISENKDKIIRGLGEYLTNFRVAQIPKDAPANLPRMIAQSKSAMFTVTITNSSVQIECSNEALEKAPEDVIFNSMMELVDKIGTFFENFIDRPFNFCGYTVNAKLKRDEIGKNAVDFMTEKQTDLQTQMMIDNSFIRNAYIQKHYYINISLRSEKDLRVTAPNQFAKPTGVEYKEDFLILEIDVNDKYGFIHENEYECEIENALQLVEDVNKFYQEKAMNFVLDGSIDYFC